MGLELIPGDLVAVQVTGIGNREGTVVGSHFDPIGRQVVEVRLDGGRYYTTWIPFVARLRRRTTYFVTPSPSPLVRWSVERTVYW